MNVLAKNSLNDCDVDLLTAIAGGNRRALEALYLNYHRRLTSFLMRITQSYENVEEVINDTFLVVWQTAKDFRNESRSSTWIFGIAYRTALKSVRRQKNHSAAISLDASAEQATDPVLDAEVQDWLLQGLGRLPVEQRLTLELAYQMGYSLEEIASITSVPLGTVKTRMYHARQKMRVHLSLLGGVE